MVLAYTVPDMYGVSSTTRIDTLASFLGFILEYRISAMPKTFLIVSEEIMFELLKQNIYQPTITKRFERRKRIQLLLLSYHNCFSILSNTSLPVPLVLLCVLFSHCRLCQVVLNYAQVALGAHTYGWSTSNLAEIGMAFAKKMR